MATNKGGVEPVRDVQQEKPGKLESGNGSRAKTLAPRWPPPDRAVSHTQVMAGQASLAIVLHSHFIMMSCFYHGLIALNLLQEFRI